MRYLILGVTEARDENGSALTVGGARLRALLAALALRAGRPVPVADLVDDVWAADPPHDAPAALQALVGRLRRVLGRDAITSAHGGYRLAAGPDEVDLYVFERLSRQGAEELDAGDPATAARTLRTALALWRGPALADLPERDHGHALRPEAHRLAALERRIEADLRCASTGRDSGAGPDAGPRALVPELMELTAAHPYDERFRAQLIRALRAEGRQADALVAYEDARHALADGLGVDPGPELSALHRELLAPPQVSSATVGRPVAVVRPLGGAGPAVVHGNLRPRLTSFVGRELELRSIRADLTRSRLVTLTGPGGSGKTRLAEEAAAHGARRDDISDASAPAPASAAPASAAADASAPAPAAPAPAAPAPAAPASAASASAASASAASASASATSDTDAWIAELAPVDDPADVPGAVLSALGLRETALLRDNNRDGQLPRTDPAELLVEHLAHCSRIRPFLLILDNCEHVIEAAATLAETLLTNCPQLRILATSREPLGVPGESVRPVGPLPPDPAHRLFAERARTVRPDFDPDPGPGREAGQDADAVAEICRRLDGQPLAIELAAARLRMLGPRQIADRLDDRFLLLTGGGRTVLPRQQTLRAVVDWSWDLLDEDERTALRQVSVFAGGWDLQAAEAVITPGADPTGTVSSGQIPTRLPTRLSTADLIGALVDKSLVVAAPTATGEMRYRLLETIHEYATERAAEVPEIRAAAAGAHTVYFLALVERAEPRIRSGDQLPWIERLETELDNIRAALQRTVVTTPSEAEAVRLVLGMGWFWWLRNFRSEGLVWAERAAALGPEPDDADDSRYWPRMHLEMLRYFLAVEAGPAGAVNDDENFRALMDRVAEAFRSSGPQSARFPGMLWPMALFATRTTTETHALINTVVDNTRTHGGAWEYCIALMFRTHMVVDMPGGMPGVDADLAELRELSRRVGDRWIRAQVASATAEAGVMRGLVAQARSAYEEALMLSREVGAYAEAPFLLARVAELAYRAGDMADFERTLTEAEHEADRYQVHDARAYIHFLRATAALERGEIAQARDLVTEAAHAIRQGSPPSHFSAVVEGLAARVAVHEPGPGRGPAAGVRGLTAALRGARDAQCAELVTGHLADCVATVLPSLGHHRAAVRILAAADGWRMFGPRTEAQQAEVDEAGQQAREELGPQLYEAERAAGSALTVDDVIELLTRITEEFPEEPGCTDVLGRADARGRAGAAGRAGEPGRSEATGHAETAGHAEAPGFTSGLTPDRLTGN